MVLQCPLVIALIMVEMLGTGCKIRGEDNAFLSVLFGGGGGEGI